MPADRLIHPKCGNSHKVSLLTDLEFRVWVQYLLSADDFGVMQATPAKLQSDNRHLLNRPSKMLAKCLQALEERGLIRSFMHQDQRFIYQHDWQKWQKVEYPRATNNPKPTAEALAQCDEPTRSLFEKYPGGQRKERRGAARSSDAPSDSGDVRDARPESVPPTRADAPAKRLTANGIRHTASGKEGEFRGDEALRQLQADYPQNRVTSGFRTESAFADQVFGDKHGAAAAFRVMCDNLENHKRSHEWRVKGMIPSLEKWLRDGLWMRQMDESAPVAEQLTTKTNRTLAAAAEVLGRRPA